jgi:arylsulfatase A-like enzyme
VDSRLVSNTDLPATILELAGATPGRPLEGRSLLGEPRQEVIISGAWEGKGNKGGSSLGVRDAVSAYFEHSNGEREFYDLVTDPYQLTSFPKP